jgi:hypothetical protein
MPHLSEKQHRTWQDLVFWFGLVFFVTYRCYLVYLSWQGRTVPPEPDDAYAYLSLVERFVRHGLRLDLPVLSNDWYISHYWYIPWVIFVQGLRALTGLTLEQAYYLNYYLGTIFLALAFAYFMYHVAGKFYAGLGMFLLGWVWGVGPTFYMIRPAVYLVALSLFCLVVLHSGHRLRGPLLFLLSPLIFMLHPMGPLVLVMFLLFFLLNSLITWQIDRNVARGLLWLCAPLFLGLLWGLLWGWPPEIGAFFASPNEIVNVVDDLSGKVIEWLTGSRPYLEPAVPVKELSRMSWWSKLLLVNQEQLHRIQMSFWEPFTARRALLWLCFLGGAAGLVVQGRTRLVSWWLVCVLTMLVLLKTHYSYRMLEFVWPATIMVVAFGLFLALRWAWNNLSRRRWQARLLLLICLVGIGAYSGYGLRLNRFWTQTLAQNQNFSWDRSCATALAQDCGPDTLIVYQSKLSICAFLSQGLWDCPGKTVLFVKKRDLRPPLRRVIYVSSRQSLAEIQRVLQRLASPRMVKLQRMRDCGRFKVFWFTLQPPGDHREGGNPGAGEPARQGTPR